jgi:hypothetical protein
MGLYVCGIWTSHSDVYKNLYPSGINRCEIRWKSILQSWLSIQYSAYNSEDGGINHTTYVWYIEVRYKLLYWCQIFLSVVVFSSEEKAWYGCRELITWLLDHTHKNAPLNCIVIYYTCFPNRAQASCHAYK